MAEEHRIHRIYSVAVLITENLNWENALLQAFNAIFLLKQKSTDFLPWVNDSVVSFTRIAFKKARSGSFSILYYDIMTTPF